MQEELEELAKTDKVSSALQVYVSFFVINGSIPLSCYCAYALKAFRCGFLSEIDFIFYLNQISNSDGKQS